MYSCRSRAGVAQGCFERTAGGLGSLTGGIDDITNGLGLDGLLGGDGGLTETIDTAIGLIDSSAPSTGGLDLGAITGGLSGPAIRPITLRLVYQCVRAVQIPVIGLGGIFTAEDAVEYFLAGARAVQIGTANFQDPRAPVHVLDGLEKFMARRGLRSLGDIVGKMKIS